MHAAASKWMCDRSVTPLLCTAIVVCRPVEMQCALEFPAAWWDESEVKRTEKVVRREWWCGKAALFLLAADEI